MACDLNDNLIGTTTQPMVQRDESSKEKTKRYKQKR